MISDRIGSSSGSPLSSWLTGGRRPRLLCQFSKETERRLGDRVELTGSHANHWSKRGGPEARKELAKLEQEIESFSATDQERLLRELTEANLRIGDNVVANRLIGR